MIQTKYDYKNLIIESQNGNTASRDDLALIIQDDIRPYIYRILHDKQLTDDITQETILRAFEHIDTIRDPQTFRVWLYRTARGKVQMHFRNRQQLDTLKVDFPDDFMCNKSSSGLSKMIYQEFCDTVAITINSLNETDRNILTLRVYQKLTYKEIAEILECSQMAAKVRFYKAKQSLKKQLKIGGFNGSMLLTALIIFGNLTDKAMAKKPSPVITSKVLKSSPAVIAIGSGLPFLAIAIAILVLLAPIAAIRDKISSYFASETFITEIITPNGITNDENNIEKMNQFLADNDYDILNIVIDPGKSMSFSFPGVITNGPGDDIFITELGPNGEAVEVYLCDETGNEMHLGFAQSPRVPGAQGPAILNYPVICKFDISDYEIQFAPTIIKLIGAINREQTSSFELHRLQARVRFKEE